MLREATIELHKEAMKFSAAHFTVFSQTHREKLHGHNYNVSAALTTVIEDEGLSFDYRYYKDKLFKLCRELNHCVILPTDCKHLQIEQQEELLWVYYGAEKIPFLQKDVILLPITNTTVEELSYWFLQRLQEDQQALAEHRIQAISVKVYSGPGQSGSSSWER